MSDVKSEWGQNLTLGLAKTPDGFASLAAAVLSQLQKHGRVFLYLDEEDNILHKDPEKEIAVAFEPVLIVSPGAVMHETYNQETGHAVVDLSQTQLLQPSGLILEEETEHVDERPMDQSQS